jgi:hypothetical protein
LQEAEHCCIDLSRQVEAGDAVIEKVRLIVSAARLEQAQAQAQAQALARPAGPDPKVLAAAAHALAERARERALAA